MSLHLLRTPLLRVFSSAASVISLFDHCSINIEYAPVSSFLKNKGHLSTSLWTLSTPKHQPWCLHALLYLSSYGASQDLFTQPLPQDVSPKTCIKVTRSNEEFPFLFACFSAECDWCSLLLPLSLFPLSLNVQTPLPQFSSLFWFPFLSHGHGSSYYDF